MAEEYRFVVRVCYASAVGMNGDDEWTRRSPNSLIDVVIPWWVNSRSRAEIRRQLAATSCIHVRDEAPPRGWYMNVVPLLVAFLTTFMILKCYCVGFFSTLAVVFFSGLMALLVVQDDGVNNITSFLTWTRIGHEIVLKLKQACDAVIRFHSADSGPWFNVGN